MENIKAIDFENWGGIDGFLRITAGGTVTRASQLKAVVPWLAKAVSMTANAVAGLPFDVVNSKGEVVDTSYDWKNIVGGINSPRRLMTLVASSLCGGSAYLLPVKTSRRLVELQYAAPHTILPYIDANGLQYFTRTTEQGKSQRLAPDEVVYFWLPDSDVEIGAPLTSPMSDALVASELLASMSATMKIYGDRGFVPAYIGNVKGMPNKDEKAKAENYLTRFLRGAYQNVVKLINSESLELVRVGAGMEELKGAYTEIQQQAIEDIGTAFGIPAALFMSDKAFASEVNSLTRTWYETSTFVSIYHTIEEVMSEQVFAPYGYRMQFAPEALSVFQEDEAQRASAVTAYTNAISSNPQVAKFVMSFMGVDLDEAQEHELEEIVKGKDEATEVDTPNEDYQPDEMDMEDTPSDVELTPDEVKDLSLWYSKAKSWSLKGKGNAVDWENKHLREEIAAPIRVKLADAKNELDIVKAFEIGRRKKPAPVAVRNDDGLKTLAASIDALVMKADPMMPNINVTMPQIQLTAQMPAQGTVNVNVPEQPAPIVNVAAPVVNNEVKVAPAEPAVNNITVQPASVNLPAMPMEATITTDKATGQKVLKVKQ